jgi:hypothetical protein
MGGYLFKPDDEQMRNTLKKYNFLYFLAHLFYNMLDMLGCHPRWSTTRLFCECREEMVKQLDILYLLRRVTILERAINNLLPDHQIRALYLLNNRTLTEAKADRHKFKWNEDTLLRKLSRKKGEQCNSEVAIRKATMR